jgi:hypothetical protein
VSSDAFLLWLTRLSNWTVTKTTRPLQCPSSAPFRPARAEDEMNNHGARLWHPWLRINRVLRVMLQTRWSAEAWSQVKAERSRRRSR